MRHEMKRKAREKFKQVWQESQNQKRTKSGLRLNGKKGARKSVKDKNCAIRHEQKELA